MKKILLSIAMLILTLAFPRLQAQVLESDSLALIDFYNAAGGVSWTNQGNWKTAPVNTWMGVTVTDGRVTELALSLNNMSGTISTSIGQLTELTKLELNGSEDNREYVDIHGSIPAELWNCTKIKRLQIKFTKITGDIPSGIESMVKLEEINFQATKLACKLPAELFELPSLKKAYLHESDFTGAVPSTIQNLDTAIISRLYLQNNKLEGPLPFVDSLVHCKVQLTGNFFSFDDVKPYHEAASHYTAFTDDYQLGREEQTISSKFNSGATLNGTVANAEAYAWFKDALTTVISTNAMLQVSATTLEDEGSYICKAQSSKVANFDIRSIYNLNITDVQGLERDSLALVDFYNAAGGANWTNQGNWKTAPVNTWMGVTVTDGRVTELALSLNNMSGTISKSIGQLTELTKLEIKGDEDAREYVDIHGSIPAELWNCTKIKRLQIKFTKITGDIPSGIESMVKLEEINFQATKLACKLPAELFELPSLKKAYLHESDFTGAVPSTIQNVDTAIFSRLYLQNNKLEGPLPFVDSLVHCKLQLTGNFFTFEDVKPYHDASAHYAKFTDDYQLAKETVVATVDKDGDYTMSGVVENAEGYAWFKDAGTTPLATTDTLKLTGFTLADEGTYVCKTQSTMVANFDIRSIYELTLNVSNTERDSLALVDFYNAAGGPSWTDQGNWLTGTLDTWVGVTVADGRVAELVLSLNNMSGTISPSIGKLSELTKLEIKGDEDAREYVNIHGSIPAELWNCTKIKRLQIKFTKITGDIPAGIESMTALEEINFQATKLACKLPAELFELPSLKKAYLHESDFNGVVPTTIQNVDTAIFSRLYLQDNKLEGPLPFIDSLLHCKVQLTGNFFTFEDVKPYHDAKTHYAAFSDDYQYAQEAENFSPTEGDEVSFEFYAKDGEAYAWFYNDATTPVSTDTLYSIASVARTDTGVYVCKVQNSGITEFDIRAQFTIEQVIAIPAFVSGASSTDGTTVSLTFDYEIADPSSEAANFAFTVAGTAITVSSLALDANDSKVVVLTLSSAITDATSELKITYTPGALKGSTGGNVAAFGPVAVSNNLGTSVNDLAARFNIYPNPCIDKLQITGEQVINSVTITNLAGKVLHTEIGLNTKTFMVETSNLNKGIYFISIESAGSVATYKVIKN